MLFAKNRANVKQTKSRLAARLTRRIIIYYTIIYVVVFIIILSFLLPRLFAFSFDKARETTTLIKQDYSDLQDTMEGYLDFLYASPQMHSLLSEYTNHPTEETASRIELDLHAYLGSQNAIKYIAIETPDTTLLSTFNYSGQDLPAFIVGMPEYTKLKSSNTETVFTPVIYDLLKTPLGDYNQSYFPVIIISKKYIVKSETFIFTLVYNYSSLIRRNTHLAENVLDSYFVFDRTGKIINSYGKADIPYTDVMDINDVSGNIRNPRGYYFYEKITSSNWIVIAYASNRALFSNIILIIVFVVILYMIPPLLFWLWLMPTSFRCLAPLTQLSNVMSSFHIGDNVELQIHTDDEIEDLSRVFNMMVISINQQLAVAVEEEKNHSETKYKLLATQIDPHFIHNTMNIINILARQNKCDDIIEINTALTRILRERLGIKASIFDTVRKELSTLEQYITIMNYRYENKVQVRFEVDDKLMDVLIPKNLLQPLVENSYYYGLVNQDGVMEGNIDVFIYSQGERIIIEVSDDGNGISPNKLTELSRNNFVMNSDGRVHIGLENIQQRLQYIYGIRDCMEIRSRLNSGTTVILTMNREPVNTA